MIPYPDLSEWTTEEIWLLEQTITVMVLDNLELLQTEPYAALADWANHFSNVYSLELIDRNEVNGSDGSEREMRASLSARFPGYGD